MKNKKNMRRFLSGFLALLTVLSTILSPILSYAADVVPVPEEPPLYEEVKNELDADEVVKAKDLELETGSIFEVEKDFTGLEIPDEKKVKITFHEAKNEEKQDFTTDYEDTYKAVYYVEPVSGHPIYQINRKLIVKEAVVQVAESENQESVSNQEDENEAEGEEPAIGTAESEEPVQDEVNVEIPSEDEIYEEVTPTEIPVEEEPIDTPIPENPSEEVSTEEPAIDDNPDTDSTFEEITDTDPEEMPEATDDSFTDGTEKTEDADGNYQVNIVRGEEFHIELNHEDGQYQPGETVVFSGDMPQGSLIAVGTTKVQANQTENTEDLLYSEVTYHEESDKFSFEMPADDIDLSVSMDQAENGIMLLATDTPWDDATNIEANKYYYYSDGQLHPFDEWTSGSTPHIIKELEVGKKYTLTETIPADGYATAESITFVVENTADIQKIEMQDDTTKILISKVDMTDGSSEVKGAKLYILNENQEVMESWTSGDQPHYVEKLPIGTYTLLEETAPKGYIVANKVTFEIKDTGDIQGAKMEDEQAMGKVILNKTDKDTKKPMKGVEFALCDSKGKVLETLVTDSAGHAESKNYPIATFKNGQYKKAITYILKETKTLDGYQLDETEHKIQFEYVNDRTPVIEYTLDLTNEKAPEKDTPETSENQEGSTPVSHSSDATSVSNSPKTGDNTNIAIFVLALAVSAGCLGTVVTVKRKRK